MRATTDIASVAGGEATLVPMHGRAGNLAGVFSDRK
jgi:hypothetical protein